MQQRAKAAAAYVAAWIPALVLWLAFAMSSGQTSLGAAFPPALLTIVIAAALGIAVRALCIRMPMPERNRLAFYAVHLIVAIAYGTTWMVATIAVEPILTHRAMWSVLRTPRAITWALTGVWLYAVIASITYAFIGQYRALRAEAALSSARLDALQQRLHPHFLFNALHTVAALVRHDSAQAEGAIEKLGDMLRYTLQEDIGHTVPFAEEWEFTRRYLDFEQLRYGDRLRVATSIDPESLHCTAPLFALQTLVENAVRHSIGTRAAGGKIEIDAHADRSTLSVRVRDDGGNGVAAQDGSRFGLNALRERLRAVYGDDARLTIASAPESFEVSLVIPRTESEVVDDD